MSRKSASGEFKSEVDLHPHEQDITEEETTIELTPADMATSGYFTNPTNSSNVSITAMDAVPGSTGPENVAQGTGPMGPTLCQANFNMNAPNLKVLNATIKAENLMIGNQNQMNVNIRGQNQDSSSEDSSSGDEEGDDLKKEIEKRRKREEKFEKTAMFRETLQSSRPISDQEMRDVSTSLLGAWRRFLRILGVDDDLQDQYYEDYISKGGLSEVVYQALDHWRRNTDTPEVQKVANALGEVQMWDTVSKYLHP